MSENLKNFYEDLQEDPLSEQFWKTIETTFWKKVKASKLTPDEFPLARAMFENMVLNELSYIMILSVTTENIKQKKK